MKSVTREQKPKRLATADNAVAARPEGHLEDDSRRGNATVAE